MSTTTVVAVDATTPRQSVEKEFRKIEAQVTAAKSAVAELESKLAAEAKFRARLAEKFDAAAVNDDSDAAHSLHNWCAVLLLRD